MKYSLASLALGLSLIAHPVFAESVPSTQAVTEFTIVIKDHKFSPDKFDVPANTRLTFIVDNQDATPEEFESHSMKLEKVIGGNTKAKLLVPALKAGEHKFFGEFNEKTAQGVVTAK